MRELRTVKCGECQSVFTTTDSRRRFCKACHPTRIERRAPPRFCACGAQLPFSAGGQIRRCPPCKTSFELQYHRDLALARRKRIPAWYLRKGAQLPVSAQTATKIAATNARSKCQVFICRRRTRRLSLPPPSWPASSSRAAPSSAPSRSRAASRRHSSGLCPRGSQGQRG